VRLGAFLRETFAPRRPDAASLARIKAVARHCLGASEETAFAVNEIACTDPSCPGIETVILVMEPGRKTWAIKVQKPLEEVTEADIRDAAGAAGE
jgi:hypothetical protein